MSKLFTKENIIMNCIAPGNIYFKGGLWDKKLKKKNHILEDILILRCLRKDLALQMK